MCLQEAERERFLQDLEEDADMRARINLYKDPEALALLAAQQQQGAAAAPRGLDEMADADDEADDDEDDVPEVPLDELLDDLEALGLEGGEEEEEGGDGEAHMETD